MLRKTLMLGLSTAAMSVSLAGTASAQNTQSGCGTNANTCAVTQTPGQSNSSTVQIVSGTGNGVTVNQTGTAETSIVQITGNTNTVNHQQAGVLDSASTTIVGNTNAAETFQGVNGSFNTATVSLLGNNNGSTIRQNEGPNGGSRNTATITAQGNNMRGLINQNGNQVAGGTTTSSNTANINLGIGSGTAATGTAIVQNVSVTQAQSGNSATVFVRGGTTANPGNPASSGQNSATVEQRNSFYQSSTAAGSGGFAAVAGGPTATDNPLTQNIADLSIAGQANGVSLLQDGVQNSATVSVNRGAAAVATGTGTDPTNGLTFTPGQSGRNAATIQQFGRGNRASVSVGGRDAAGQQGIGNTLEIVQGLNAPADLGNNQSATVFQFGQLSDIRIQQTDNTATVNSTARQGGSTADVSQSSFSSSISLSQSGSNDALLSQGGGSGSTQSGNSRMAVSQVDLGSLPAGAGGTGGGPFDPPPPPGTPTGARNYVAVSQAGRDQELNINQRGVNASATVFQRFNSTPGAAGSGAPGPVPSGSDVFVAQGTDGAVATPLSGPAYTQPAFFAAANAAAPNLTGLNQNLTANVDQGGRGVVVIRQDGDSLSATVNQNPSSTVAIVNGANTATVQVSQVGRNQSATVNQNGRNSTATVDQRNGNTAGGTNALTSVVQITQSGGGNGASTAAPTVNQNIAIARQGTAAAGAGGQTGTSVAGGAGAGATGPAGDPDSRAAGAYGNRIEISQANGSTGTTAGGASPNSGNLYAEVEQRGQGQLARVTQTGFNNSASILQDTGATNAIALVTQSGNGNVFFLTQTQANQFLRVNQTGSNNQTVTANGPGGGGTFSNTAPPLGTFTTTP